MYLATMVGSQSSFEGKLVDFRAHVCLLFLGVIKVKVLIL